MNIKYTRLPTGYHHVRATDFHHLFAQWPVSADLDQEHVSFGESQISEQTLIDFMTEAEECAEMRHHFPPVETSDQKGGWTPTHVSLVDESHADAGCALFPCSTAQRSGDAK